VAALSASSLYLAKNQTYRGQCQLTFDPRHAARLDELTPDEYAAMAGDLFVAQHAIARAMAPDHVNIESLGNVVPHLHWHVIARFDWDSRFPAPVWAPVQREPDAGRLAEVAALLPAVEKDLLSRLGSA